MRDLITIIMLTYNNVKYYKESIQSVLDQTYEAIELIISDDASDYFPKGEIKEFIEKNNRGNIVNVEILQNTVNLGIVRNYNKALHSAKGEYIFYLAVDDLFYNEDTLQHVSAYFYNNPDKLIATGYRDVYSQDMMNYIKTLPRENEVKFIENSTPYELYEKLCIGSFISGCNTPFRRKLLGVWGYMDESYNYLEDYPRYLNLLRKGYSIGFINKKLIKYRTGGVTTNGNINDLLREDLYLTARKEKAEYILGRYNKGALEDCKLIGWGTGDCYRECKDKYNLQVSYLIDSNEKLHRTKIGDVQVKAPKALLKENMKNTKIVIFSYANYFDIANCLEQMGFVEERDFMICTPEILSVLEYYNR